MSVAADTSFDPDASAAFERAIRQEELRVWATWPWNQCRARAVDEHTSEVVRCEVWRRHQGDHAAERGMYSITWPAKTGTTTEPRVIAR